MHDVCQLHDKIRKPACLLGFQSGRPSKTLPNAASAKSMGAFPVQTRGASSVKMVRRSKVLGYAVVVAGKRVKLVCGVTPGGFVPGIVGNAPGAYLIGPDYPCQTTPCIRTSMQAKVCASIYAHQDQYAICTRIRSTSRASNPELRQACDQPQPERRRTGRSQTLADQRLAGMRYPPS